LGVGVCARGKGVGNRARDKLYGVRALGVEVEAGVVELGVRLGG